MLRFHLVLNFEPARTLQCRVKEGFVEVVEFLETSQPNINCAGNPSESRACSFQSSKARLLATVRPAAAIPQANCSQPACTTGKSLEQ